jgi:hypothetical protein
VAQGLHRNQSHNHAPRYLHQMMSPVRAAVRRVFPKLIQQDSRYLSAYGSASTAAGPPLIGMSYRSVRQSRR